MKCAILLSLVAFSAAVTLQQTLQAPLHAKNFEQFKKTYNKKYATPAEEAIRFTIYVSNSLLIEAHNAEESLDGRHGFTLGENEFADMNNDEFRSKMYGYKMRTEPSNAPVFMPPEGLAVPDTVDWRPKGYVTGIKNQGQCGSCWSFSATGSLEGQHFKKTGKLVSLSEQNLVDCSTKFGNEGCNGGLMDDAFKYIKSNGGVDTEASYPYTAKDGTCHFNKANVGATCTGFVDIPSKDENALQQAVASVGPISVAIDASSIMFQFYRSGVYNPWICSQTSLDHGVLAVGYGTDNGKAYWLVKNSWGTSWGMKGYIEMIRNHGNKCGIATQASYPTV